MRDLFEGIEWLFEEILFIPLDALRELQFDSWWLANAINFIFLIIGIAAFAYWLKELKKFQDRDEEETKSSKHSPYLG
ncbi:uracil phosphoribosyltransferase [Zunongwangia sp. F363]|uniref:Uracil phosphoribosyltransferase n=2 Tax=Autumnicola tepida TaxID=3075595 RepID=A0ABU3C734_9FLAO|nr:uracil phosphoribosyltransferase [Zunongwangia sp. F363]MDT0642158.1 uracil phosphoribosyltransferase [Zunongwangia sp. F363]